MIRCPDPGLVLDSGRMMGAWQYFAETPEAGRSEDYRAAVRSRRSVGNSAWSRSRLVGRSAWAQSDEIAAAEREFGGAFRSSSAASTVEASGDGGDGNGDDVSMAGPEATNGEEDPGYATDCYGADTEAGEAMDV